MANSIAYHIASLTATVDELEELTKIMKVLEKCKGVQLTGIKHYNSLISNVLDFPKESV